MGGFWEFPGGKIEENEEATLAIIREIKEELSISISALDSFIEYTYRGDDIVIKMQSFKCFSSANIITLEDHDRIEWVKAHDLMHFTLAPADLVIAEALISLGKTSRYSRLDSKVKSPLQGEIEFPLSLE